MAAVGEAAVTASELPVSATVTKYFNIIDPVWQKYPVTDKGELLTWNNVIKFSREKGEEEDPTGSSRAWRAYFIESLRSKVQY